MKAFFVVLALALTGCATSDPNYLAALAAHERVQIAATQSAALASIERSKAEQARAEAIARIAETGDATARIAAVMALQTRQESAQGAISAQVAPTPQPPESGADKALRWASVLVPGATQALGIYANWRGSVASSDNATRATIASYGAFRDISAAGIAGVQQTATASYGALTTLGGYIQAPQPNITLSGQGVIGSGTFAPVTTTTTTNTTTTTTASNNTTRNCQGGNGAQTGNVGTTGSPNGGPGGAATC